MLKAILYYFCNLSVNDWESSINFVLFFLLHFFAFLCDFSLIMCYKYSLQDCCQLPLLTVFFAMADFFLINFLSWMYQYFLYLCCHFESSFTKHCFSYPDYIHPHIFFLYLCGFFFNLKFWFTWILFLCIGWSMYTILLLFKGYLVVPTSFDKLSIFVPGIWDNTFIV